MGKFDQIINIDGALGGNNFVQFTIFCSWLWWKVWEKHGECWFNLILSFCCRQGLCHQKLKLVERPSHDIMPKTSWAEKSPGFVGSTGPSASWLHSPAGTDTAGCRWGWKSIRKLCQDWPHQKSHLPVPATRSGAAPPLLPPLLVLAPPRSWRKGGIEKGLGALEDKLWTWSDLSTMSCMKRSKEYKFII